MANSEQSIKVQDTKTQEVYVGPRPFERNERNLFFGRDREISELLSLVTSSRVVLCYAPSGAGKTSLINAGLQPRLEKEGFEVLPSVRVRGLIPDGIDQKKIINIYVFNALLNLAGEAGIPAELMSSSMSEYLSKKPHATDEEDFPEPRILMFDQFEELLTSYPDRWQEREGFFHQVHDALQADPLLRVIFIMREDFLARIEPFTRLLKPLPQARFRLDLLGPDGAQAAVLGPIRGTGKRFKEGVVASLIEELLKVRVETAQGEATEVVGEYVEPVQLQVVCRNLWTSLPPDVEEISQEHLQAYGDVDQALRDFYESCLTQAKTGLNANESNLRQWFEHQLITPAGTRGIVFRDAKHTAGLPNNTVDFLENQHLIRGEWRAGSRWYELTHDRFIEPIQRANEGWRKKRQSRLNRLVMAGGLLLLALILTFGTIRAQQSASQSVRATVAVAVQTAAQTAVSVAEQQANVANENAAISKSKQLAAEALLSNDRDLSLLLAIEANRSSSDTQEARRSLQKVLSRQPFVDGEFLQMLKPAVVSPSLVKRLEDHENWVVSVAFSPDGKRFVSGSADSTLILWDVATAKAIGSPWRGHTSNVLGVAFSPDGRLVASAGLDSQVILWDVTTGQPVGAPLRGHDGMATSVAFSPDGKLLASGGADSYVRIWDVANLQLLGTLSHPAAIWAVAWSPDGQYLATAGADGNINILKTNPFSEFLTLKGHKGLIRTLSWSPDGKSLASGSVIEETNQSQGQIYVWDVASAKIISRPIPENYLPIRAITFDPSGRTIAIGRDDGTITFWDVQNQSTIGNPLKAHNHRVMSIAFSPDAHYMVSGSIDRTVALWDLFAPTRNVTVSEDGSLMATSQGSTVSLWDRRSDSKAPLATLYGHTGDIVALALNSDGSVLASSGLDGTIRLWDTKSAAPIAPPLTRDGGNVITLDLSPDGSTLVTGSDKGEVVLWDVASQKVVHSFSLYSGPVLKVLFEGRGVTVQITGNNGVLLEWDPMSDKIQEVPLPANQGGGVVTSVALSEDGQKAAYFQEESIPSLSNDRRAHGIELSRWDNSFDATVNPKDIDFVVIQATDGVQVDAKFDEFQRSIQPIPMRGAMHFYEPDDPWQKQADLFLSTVKDKGFHFYVLDLELTPKDGSTTFLADAQKWLQYVDERSDQKILLQTGGFYMTSFGADGEWMKSWPFAIMNYPLEPDRNGTPFLPQGVQDWTIWQYTEKGNGAEYGVGNNNIYLAVYNGTPLDMWNWLDYNTASLSIFDRNSNQIVRPARTIQVTGSNGMAFSSDGAYLAVSGDGLVSLLDAGTGEEITSLTYGGGNSLSLNFTPDDNKMIIGMEDGTVLLWDLSILQPGANVNPMIEVACSQVSRSFTESELIQYFSDPTKRNTCPEQP